MRYGQKTDTLECFPDEYLALKRKEYHLRTLGCSHGADFAVKMKGYHLRRLECFLEEHPSIQEAGGCCRHTLECFPDGSFVRGVEPRACLRIHEYLQGGRLVQGSKA